MGRASRWALLLVIALVPGVSAELDSASVRAAADYSARHRGLSFLVMQNGRTLFQQYPGGGNAEMAMRIYSGTKAFWSLAALAAAEDRLLNLDEPVSNTISRWRTDPRKAAITIRELLNFDSGLEPKFSLHELEAGNRDEIALRSAVIAQPGSAFIYGPAALQVFDRVLKVKLAGKRPVEYLEQRVLKRLGLDSQRYIEDRAGNPLLASGFVLTARQWAKLGDLVLHDGAPVISKTSFQQCWRGSVANPMFSFGWWNNLAAPYGREIDVEQTLARPWQEEDWREGCLSRDAPSDLLASIGSGHQRLYIIPSLRLVVVRHGDGGSFSDTAFLRLLLHRQRP